MKPKKSPIPKLKLSDFQVPAGKPVRLKEWPTEISPLYQSKEHYRELLATDVAELSSLQRQLYATNSFSVLIIFQATDAAGKDGAIRHVLSGINPQGCQVYSFQPPSAEELDHDFLWRTNCRLPERGRIGIFNRSYYEEVLIVRVHPELLARQRLPAGDATGQELWRGRYRSITELEAHLHRNGTRVIKFFLHQSKEEQRRRLLARLDDPEKNWKFSEADISERQYWGQYRKAYEQCLAATSTELAPWHVVPADDKLNARLIVARTVIGVLRDLDLSFPKPSQARLKELQKFRAELAK
jgi:PPK2 family polyphosphate:nucleotide phosphotransferase